MDESQSAGRKQRRIFTPQFKQDAVRLITDEKYTFKAAAEALGVGEQSLRQWHAKLAVQGSWSLRLNSLSVNNFLKPYNRNFPHSPDNCAAAGRYPPKGPHRGEGARPRDAVPRRARCEVVSFFAVSFCWRPAAGAFNFSGARSARLAPFRICNTSKSWTIWRCSVAIRTPWPGI